ncbi:hypothetical protein BFP70_07125 [Thioclava sp. SK-1]|uniref:prepilin peptidase n=1 Tax=Thioclava sp. SK-1 TaxID=1889770 RepID=UPI000825E625|nr:prepilin peptidase [Thioclava sp. SK-1]OCX65899.1 hypothetical protein BFP70_07125 [Thioclava sp. SK-1]
MLGLSFTTSTFIFFILTLPVCIWVIFTDLRDMKIYNKAVLTLIAIFAVAGPFLLPIDVYLWRWVNLVVVFVVMLLYMMIRDYGAGDLKFFSATALFYSPSNASFLIFLLVAAMIATVVQIKICRALPSVQRKFGHWKTFEKGKKTYPMGLGFAMTLILYQAYLTYQAYLQHGW